MEKVTQLIVGGLSPNINLNLKFLGCYKFFAMKFDPKFYEKET
jgi:hypothetical protein